MLFWCFITAYAAHKWTGYRRSSIVLLPLSFSLPFIVDNLPSTPILTSVGSWFCWFLLGIYAYRWSDKLSAFLHKYRLDYLSLAVFVIGNWFFPTAYGAHTPHGYVLQAMVTLGLWSLFHNMGAPLLRRFKFLSAISRASFGIYIFHAWLLLFMVSSTAKRLFGMETLCLSHPILFPLVLFTLNLALSYLLTRLLMMNKYSRMLVG